MKEYFSHDYNARNDIKLKKLIAKHGAAGIGVYWCIIEMLYENGGVLPLDIVDVIAYDLRVDSDMITDILSGYDLFCINDVGCIYSEAVNKRLSVITEKREKARKSAAYRWREDQKENISQSEGNANALRTQCEVNAIKVKDKVKEKKNNIINKFIPPSIDEVEKYCKERSNNVDAAKFVDFYEAKGWKIGNQRMKDWKACVRTWERRNEAHSRDKPKKYIQREFTAEEMDAIKKIGVNLLEEY